MPSSSDALRLEGVTKHFGPVTALKAAHLTLKPGEVRALMGGNGSGKSTFAKILLGILHADAADITVGEESFTGYDASTARRLRVGGTYQEISLLDDLTVLENLFIRHLPRRAGLLASPGRSRQRAVEALDRVHLSTSILETKVRDLPLDQRALAELAKVLMERPRFLVMDELTASLRQEHVEMIGGLLRDLSAEGVATLYVSHRLEEVEEFCQSATVLRNGVTVLEADTLAQHSMADYMAAMTATSADANSMRTRQQRSSTSEVDKVLEVAGLQVSGWSDGSVDLHCNRGEIVGLAGLTGNGQTQILRSIYGATDAPADRLLIDGSPPAGRGVRGRIRSGVAFISGDREREMSFGVRSVGENLSVVAVGSRKRFAARSLMERMRLVGHSRSAMRGLSGGNQQKVIVGRWLGMEPRLLLADDPTRGVDVATRTEIHKLFRELTEDGSSVLVTSSDDRELSEICDRVYVIYRARVVAELTGDDVDEQVIGHASIDPSTLEGAR